MQSSAASGVLRIGTRGSPLALKQAQLVRDALTPHGLAVSAIELIPIRTSGDKIQDRPLAEAGGKGLFAKEIEQALLDGAIDLAKSLRELAAGSTLGTASLRRQAMVKRLRPDLRVVTFRGNVETRLRKLDAGEADATLLALAGLNRLGLASAATAILAVEEFLPAVGQGAIGIEARAADARVRDLLAAINHAETMIALVAERAFLAELDGSCRTPIAGHAEVANGALRFHGMILKPDGSEAHETRREGDARDAEALGADAGRELKRGASPDFFQVG